MLLRRGTEEAAQRFRQIVNTVHGIITIKDLEGRYQQVNPRAQKLFALPEQEIIGKTAAEIFPGDVAEIIMRADQEVLKSGEHHVCEEVLSLDGEDKMVVSERFPLRDYKGDMVALCCVSRDVTRERELQRELLQTERLIAVGKLAAGGSHELNNPLTGILTFAEELLLDVGGDDPRREDYELIINEAMRCRRIVRDLLDFSRQKAPQRIPQHINEIVARTVTMIERQASFHDVTIELELMPSLPMVRFDASQIQQAILNLVINARDANKARGRLTITSRLGDDGKTVVIDVKDEGCGISKEQQQLIFEPFFSTKGGQGNGLGLPAVVGVMAQHEGRVELEIEVGAGTTFRLIFPVAPS